MDIGLTNARLSVGKTHELQTQKVTPARTSIAEDAIFIPKPHKRVEFKAVTSQEVSAEDIKLPGSGQTIDLSGKNIKLGDLGKHGLTAEMDASAYSGSRPSTRMEMVINNVPEKDFDVIAGQEEGRQTNHAGTTHYSQQYDAYGRPRIGFSREPYDFAATKFIQKSSEIRLKDNIAQSKEAFAYADQRYNKQDVADIKNKEMALGAPDTAEQKLEEAKTPSITGESEENSKIFHDTGNSSDIKNENEIISSLPGQNQPKFAPTGEQGKEELLKKMGIDFTRLITGNNNTSNPADKGEKLPDHTREKNTPSISLKV